MQDMLGDVSWVKDETHQCGVCMLSLSHLIHASNVTIIILDSVLYSIYAVTTLACA